MKLSEDCSIEQYLKEIGQFEVLTKEQEQELSRKALTGDKEATKKLINSNLKLVASLANQYKGVSELTYLELIQEGNIGLIKAIEKFEPDKDFKFSTYATWWIKQAMTRAMTDKGRAIRLPAHVVESLTKINRELIGKKDNSGNNLDLENISAKTGLSIKKIKKYINIDKDVSSLNCAVNSEKDITLQETIESLTESPENEIILKERKVEILKILKKTLNEQQFFVIVSRFGLINDKPKTLHEIGNIIKVSRERVRQIEEKALKKLRRKKTKKILKDFF